jgi:hypothetical protein
MFVIKDMTDQKLKLELQKANGQIRRISARVPQYHAETGMLRRRIREETTMLERLWTRVFSVEREQETRR